MLALSVLTFAAFGWLLVVVGAHQAELAHAMSLDLSQSALLGAALAIGAGLGITACGPLYDRYPPRPLWAGSALLCGLSLLSIDDAMTFGGAFGRIVIAGLGGGAYNTVVNAAVSDRYGAKSRRPLAIVHASATVGAVAGPLLAELVDVRFGWTASFQILGGVHVVAAVAALLAPLPGRPDGVTNDDEKAARLELGPLLPWLAITFAYVSMEAITTLFAVPFAQTVLQLDAGRGRYAISAFWAGVLGSRVLLMASPRALGRREITIAGALGMVSSGATLLLKLPYPELTFGMHGLAIGLVYPLAMAMIGDRFVRARGTALGLAGGAGAVGGSLSPWLAGVVGDRFGVGAAFSLLIAGGASVAAAARSARGVDVARELSP